MDATHFTDRFEDRISHINVCESLLHVAIILFFICDQHISDIKAVCCFNIVGALCFRMSHTCVLLLCCFVEGEKEIEPRDVPCKFYRQTWIRSYSHWNADSISPHETFSRLVLIYICNMIRTIECDEKQSFGRIQSDNGSGLIYGDREGVHIESVIIFCVC